MATSVDVKEDPLIAALPPATDYITYLTLLEYQLKPDNLSTLNKLLSDDDGTLASEIGWDLLKIVLPMLQIVPNEANECLNIIARRGNPREVVVRVAEELERLGQYEDDNNATDNSDDDVDGNSDADEDDLPTFAGEAPRIHLGDMKLDGNPTTKISVPPTIQHLVSDNQNNERLSSSAAAQYGTDNILILKALFSMLRILHPRIKTQYPSRFLATSLPAALAAYRHITITKETTTAFVEFLSNLSGKHRPALPPRASTNSSNLTLNPTSTSAAATMTNTITTPTLPDPEAKIETAVTTSETQSNETAIIQRLLQAVMLEVLDEYAGSFQSTEQPSMAWTARLREYGEPMRVLPNRLTESQRWTQSSDLKSRDDLVESFLKLSKDINLDIGSEVDKLIEPEQHVEDEDFEKGQTDYPSNPSQIPFTTPGLVLLFAADNFTKIINKLPTSPFLSLRTVQVILKLTFAPREETTHPPSLSQTDAILSLMYTSIHHQFSQFHAQTESKSGLVDLPLLANLTNLFTTSPEPSTRDSAHHLTSILLHNYTDSETKLLYFKSLLAPNQSPASPIHDIQQGNLRSLAVNWLKDEFIAHSKAHNSSNDAAASNITLDPELINSDGELAHLVFPNVPDIPSPFITSHPSSATKSASSTSTEEDLESLLLQLPFYISSLNLVCILASIPSTAHEHESVLNSTTVSSAIPSQDTGGTALPIPDSGGLLPHIHSFITSLTAWKDLLLTFGSNIAKNQARASEKGGDGNGAGPLNLADLYALEDAMGRAYTVLEGL